MNNMFFKGVSTGTRFIATMTALVLVFSSCAKKESENNTETDADPVVETVSDDENEVSIDSVIFEKNEPKDEYYRAYELGIATPDEISRRNEICTGKEAAEIVGRMVEVTSPALYEDIKSKYGMLKISDDISRHDLITYLFLVGQQLGTEYIEIKPDNYFSVGVKEGCLSEEAWDSVPSWNSYIFGEEPQDLYTIPHGESCLPNEYLIFFSTGMISNYSGKTLLEADDESYDLKFKDNATLSDTILASLRLHDNGIHFNSDDIECRVTDETIDIANSMPRAAWNELPDWKGYHLSYNECIELDDEEYISLLAEHGFNFLRVPLIFQDIFEEQSVEYARPGVLWKMDELVNLCAKYGIHVCFDVHYMPGQTMNVDNTDDYLFDNADSQKLFVEFWSKLAGHYCNVPSNLLSFDLLNEPHNLEFNLENDQYAAVMLPAIDAIKAVSPERLIFVDMVDHVKGNPIEELAEAEVAQAVHPYVTQRGENYWPVYFFDGALGSGRDISVHGDFIKGTEVTLRINQCKKDSVVEIYGNNILIEEWKISEGIEYDGDYMSYTDAGTENESWDFTFAVKEVTVYIPEDCTEIRIAQAGENMWTQLKFLRVDQCELFTDTNVFKGKGDPVDITITDDNTIVSKYPGAVYTLDKEGLKDMISVWDEFTKRTGVKIMIQEFGATPSTGYQAILDYTDDFLSALEEYDIPWCTWSENVGPIMSKKFAYTHERFTSEGIYREGANYITEKDHYLVDEGLMEVFSKHMK